MNATRLRMTAILTPLLAGTALAHADPSADQVRTLCLELGLSPASMAALGMNLESTQSALARLRDADTQITALRQTQAQAEDVAGSLAAKRRTIRVAADPAEAAALQTEIDALLAQAATLAASAESFRNALLSEFLPDTLEGPTAQRTCRPGDGIDQLPVEYRALDLAPDAAKQLAAALASVRRAEARDQTPDPAAAQLVAQHADLPAVAQARGRMTAHLPTIEQLFFIWE